MIERFYKENKIRVQYSLLGTVLFFMAANAFACLNLYPQHDALNYMFFFAGNWEIQLGRFLLPVYGMLRGSILVPWLIGLLSMIFLAGTVYLVTDLLEIHKPVYIVLTAGFLSANLFFTEVLGAFPYVADAFVLAVLLACLGVYLAVKKRTLWGRCLSALCFFLSFGLYQAFVTVALVLYIAVICREAELGKRLKKEDWIRWILYVLPLAAGAVIYMAIFKFSLHVLGLGEVQYYDSISSLSSLDIPGTLIRALNYYRYYPYIFFERQCVTGNATKLANLVLFGAAALLAGRSVLRKKERFWNHVVVVLGVLALPIASLLTDILMGGRSITYRTAFAVYLIYPILLCILSSKMETLRRWVRYLLFFCCGVVLYQNILYSNGAYATQKILYDRAMVDVGRILSDLGEEEEYVIDETKVVVIGEFSSNEHLADTGFDSHVMDGFGKNAITYTQTFESFIHVLGEDIELEEDPEVLEAYRTLEEVEQMPSFPQSGYCRMIDGRMVIKLSEE